MIERPFWIQQVDAAFERRSMVWLAGVRRTGKTTLCKVLSAAEYFDCELPSVRRQLEDPEFFWQSRPAGVVVLDEIHKLLDPSNVLKIAADHFPQLRIVATGSSTLAARRKFRDTLTDRKQDVYLQPLLVSELASQGLLDLDKRLLQGGLPPAYISTRPDDLFYREWLESFWAKDIQELFVIDRRASFMKMAELLLRHSGSTFQAAAYATPCEISRQTVQNYLDALETALFVHVVRPWERGLANDIVKMPKVYAFDTGFVCYARALMDLRTEDKGLLLEHVVLSEIIAAFGRGVAHYWRDKQKHEIDYVLAPNRRSGDVHAIECKWSRDAFDPSAMQVFRKLTPKGLNILTAPNIRTRRPARFGSLEVVECPPWEILSCFQDTMDSA